MELASIAVCIGPLRFSADLHWGSDDDQPAPPAPTLLERPEVIEVPEVLLDDEDDETGLGFRG